MVATNMGGRYDFQGLMLKDVTPKMTKMWWRYPNLLKLNMLLLTAILTQATTGYDGSMLNGMQSLPQWRSYFDYPAGARLGVLANGTTFGLVLALPLGYYSADRFGRRRPITFGSVILIFGAILQCAAQNFAWFVVGRVIIGVGLGVVGIVSPLLLAEVSYPSQRGKMTSLVEPTWPLGALIAAWVTYGTFSMHDSTWSWRIPSICQCFTSIIQLVMSLFVPESPRWLIYNNRREEAQALKVITKYHADGDANSRLVAFEMAESRLHLKPRSCRKRPVGWNGFEQKAIEGVFSWS